MKKTTTKTTRTTTTKKTTPTTTTTRTTTKRKMRAGYQNITFQVSAAQLKTIKKMAATHTMGNLSLWVRTQAMRTAQTTA